MNVPGLKELIGNSMMIILGGMLALYFIATVITTIKNKTQKRTTRQIICQGPKKTFSARNFISNYDEFISENTKGMTLFEVKDFIKNVDLEIYRLVMRGVR